MQLILNTTFTAWLARSKTPFADIMALTGERYRKQLGRETLRFKFHDQFYFIKKYTGVGWKEIFKNLFTLKIPVVGAKNEYLALKKLKSLGIPVAEIIGYGEKGWNPAKRQSFLIMRDIAAEQSLEDLSEAWKIKSPLCDNKKKLIKKVADIARAMHQSGMNHRDFYICHFLLKNNEKLFLIDLHRAQIRKQVPYRWLVKDLAGLYFSSMDVPLTQRDYYLFLRSYFQQPLREIMRAHRKMLCDIERKARALYAKNRNI